jgi:hypothetical protein
VNYGVQDDAIIRTESTFSFGELAIDAAPDAVEPAVDPVAVEPAVGDELSRVPVISTLWPT